VANARIANKIYIDSTGSVLAEGPVRIAYILFTPSAANDQIVLRESASGSDIFFIQEKDAKQTHEYDFSLVPMIFTNGLYVQTLSSGAKAVIITTGPGV
jgi:hypothetical protein